MNYGLIIRKLRIEKYNENQVDFSKRIGITQSYLSSIENGKINHLKINIMKTAIQNLYQNIIGIPEVINLPIDLIQKITAEFAKSMDEEKQQIIDAAESCAVTTGKKGELLSIPGEQYYNETFTTNK